MLTCKEFLQELNDFLDDGLDPALRTELQRHMNECPNCWVVCDTTMKTVKVFKGMQPQPLPQSIHTKLWDYLGKHCNCKSKEQAKLEEEKAKGLL